MKSYLYIAAALVFAVLPACGKFANPVPPEAVSPRAVDALEAIADVGGITLKWQAPQLNQRGEELEFIDGYRIYRKVMQSEDQLLDQDIAYEQVAMIEDTHLAERDRRREEARAAGKPTRRVRIEDELTRFEYVDRNVQPGRFYAYRIVPVNQGSVEGQVQKIVRVHYRGENSQIVQINESDFEETGFDELA